MGLSINSSTTSKRWLVSFIVWRRRLGDLEETGAQLVGLAHMLISASLLGWATISITTEYCLFLDL